MVLLGDKAQLEARFGLFGDSANLDVRLVHGLRREFHRLEIFFGRTRWNSSMTWVIWNLVSVCLEMELVSVQYSVTVCTKCTIGSEIVLDTPEGTPRLRDSTACSFWYVWRSC
jgi:hypothetical protein